MEHEILFHGDYFEVRTSGDANTSGLLAFAKDLLDHPDWKPGSRVLVDYTELKSLDSTKFDFTNLSSISSFIKSNMDRIGGARMATIITRDGGSEVVLNLRDSISEYSNAGVERKLFYTREEALNWLLS